MTTLQEFLQNIDDELTKLGFRRSAVDYWHEGPDGSQLHAAVLAVSDDDGSYATWMTACTPTFRGLFWGHYDLDGAAAGLENLDHRTTRHKLRIWDSSAISST